MATTRQQRLTAITALEAARNSMVIVYVTSTREGLEAQMAMDVIPTLFEHVRGLAGNDRRIDLLIHSNGGEGTVPWRIMTLLREYCTHLAVMVPHRAFSAATLAALGADEIVMGPLGMLGPTDPTITTPFNPEDPSDPSRRLGISVEDVVSYISLVKEDVGITHEDELVQAFNAMANKVHPLALGNVKRSNSQGRMMGEKLLKSRQSGDLSDHDLAEIVDSLSSKLYFHGHPINRKEAHEDLKLHVAPINPAIDELMWDVYQLYSEEMKLEEPFNQFTAFKQQLQAALPAPPQVTPQGVMPSVPAVHHDTLGPETIVMVESVGRADALELEFYNTVTVDWDGSMQGKLGVRDKRWTTPQ